MAGKTVQVVHFGPFFFLSSRFNVLCLCFFRNLFFFATFIVPLNGGPFTHHVPDRAEDLRLGGEVQVPPESVVVGQVSLAKKFSRQCRRSPSLILLGL